MRSNEYGFTGLEAAIVLVAFVVVAAVFSYVVLGAGFFTTQTAQATVHTGVSQVSSSIEVVGNIMGIQLSDTTTQLSYVNASVALSAGGTAMDLSQMVVSYSDTNGGRNPSISNTANLDCGTLLDTTEPAAGNLKWCVAQKINEVGNTNNLLEPNEIWVLSIQTPSTASVNEKITINFQPAIGAVSTLSRTLPGAFSRVQAIY